MQLGQFYGMLWIALQYNITLTPTKDYCPKRQVFKRKKKIFFSIHYGVKFNYL